MRNGLIGLVSTLVLAATLATAGCGGNSSGGGAGGSSGSGGTGSGGTGSGGTGGGGSVTNLDGTKGLGALTPAEGTQLCSDAYAYFARNISRATLCKSKGLSYGISSSAPNDSVLQKSCTSQETACLQATPNSPSCQDIAKDCTVTVSQYSSCITDQAAAFTQTATGLASCATVTNNDLAPVWAFMTADPPTSCMSIINSCPTLDLPTPFSL
jgi:hypothetical protein